MKNNYIKPSMFLAKKRNNKLTNVEKTLFNIDIKHKLLGTNKKFYIKTYGCQANIRDTETILGILYEMNYINTDNYYDADLIIFNTCAIRKNAENKVIGEIGHLKKLLKDKSDLIFALCGCMAQEETIIDLLINKHKHVNLIFGTHNIYRLPELLYQVSTKQERIIEVFSKQGDIIENVPVKRLETHKAWINIMYGCDKFCSFCIVPFTRGKQRSRNKDDIIDEIKVLVDKGYKEITLLGQNVNAYGKDLNIDYKFSDLANTKISRIRFTTSHPWDFSDQMIDAIKNYDNIMPYIHLPVQSGNNDILKNMRRRYTVEEYKILYNKIKNNITNCTFSTDIIVGFPNESDQQFNDTLDLIDYCRFDNAFTFIYSPRDGTYASTINDSIDIDTKRKRLLILNDKVNMYAKINNDKYLNKELKVLVDGISKKNINTYSGYSEENKLVNFTGTNINVGDIVNVKILECKSWSLNGIVI